MAEEGRIIKLALSLHATTQETRERLMPIAKKWKLDELMLEIEAYYRAVKKSVTYEYILFDGINDTDADVKRLAKIARRVPSKVNLIPFHDIDFTNPTGFSADLMPTPPDRFERFVKMLRDEGVRVLVRSSSGVDIDAACGQLALSTAPQAA
jgi:23S rRNA (adenine2503-C2)-methyltransferase